MWIIVRLLFVGYWAYEGWKGLSSPSSFPLTFAHVGFAVLAGAFGARFWLIRPYLAPGRTKPWLAPSWVINPFQTSQPFQFIQLCGVSFLAMALTATLRGARSVADAASSYLPTEWFGGGFGLGLLIGLYWAVYVYRAQFKRVGVHDA
jgi:hypothetical protein